MSDIILSVQNVSKLYGQGRSAAQKMLENGASKKEVFEKTGVVAALDRVSFDVKKGSFFVVIGLSGSGKSTVIRCVNMINRPTSGAVMFDGKNVGEYDGKELREFRRTKVAMVFQNFGLMSHRDVLSNVTFGQEIRGVHKNEREEKARELIELVGLGGFENQQISQLSGGMRQRVGIARALCNDPDVLLMDEPFSALDPIVKKDMQFEMMSIQQRLGKTIVFITHDINEAFKLGDEVAIMRDGRIEQIATPEIMCSAPKSDYVREFIEGADKTKTLSVKNIMRTPCLVRLGEGIGAAIMEMRSTETSTAYVVGRDMEFVGVVTIKDAILAHANKKVALDTILIKDVARVDMHTAVSDIVSASIDCPFPLAVVDNTGKLKGIVSRAAILSTIV